MRNPDWVHGDIIVAMDLYLRADRKQLPPGHEDVVRLSEVLNRLLLHPPSLRAENFRKPAGISMILGKFLGIDPLHDQPGLSRNNQLQSIVWKDFIDDLHSLHRTAQAIQAAGSDAVPEADEGGFDEEGSFPEGHMLTRLHLSRERNRAAVVAKLNDAWRKEDHIACEACGFDFLAYYGDSGRGFAECCHLVPLSDTPFGWKTRISDLAIVCANCHRMLHRGRPLPTIDALRSAIAQAKRLQPGGVS